MSYLIKNASKPASLHSIGLMTDDAKNVSSRNQVHGNIRADIRFYMRAKAMGSVEAAWGLFKYFHVRFIPPVATYTIKLEND